MVYFGHCSVYWLSNRSCYFFAFFCIVLGLCFWSDWNSKNQGQNIWTQTQKYTNFTQYFIRNAQNSEGIKNQRIQTDSKVSYSVASSKSNFHWRKLEANHFIRLLTSKTIIWRPNWYSIFYTCFRSNVPGHTHHFLLVSSGKLKYMLEALQSVL